MKKVLMILMCVCMILCFMPTAAFAAEDGGQTLTSSVDEGENGDQDEAAYVAQIDTAQYTTLDEAISKANDGDTIVLLDNCSAASITVANKSLTIKGSGEEKPTITLTKRGIDTSNPEGNPDKRYLRFENCKLDIQPEREEHPVGNTADLISNTDLIFDNCDITIVNSQNFPGSAIYLYQESNLYLQNKSHLRISGFSGERASGIFADNSEYSNKDNRNIKLSGVSSLTISDCDWHGMTVNPIDITIDGNSLIDISNCGNPNYGGGLGCYYGKLTITNGSTLKTDENRGKSWGTFVKELEIDSTSTLSSCKNTGNGIDIGGTGVVHSGAKVTLENNSRNGLISYSGGDGYWAGKVKIETGAEVSIRNNARGIQVMSGAALDMAVGTVTTNGTGSHYKNGGGIFVDKSGSAIIGSAVTLYNNHASEMGDDIYCDENAQITFGAVGTNWILDDCNHAIDGWYDDDQNVVTEADGTTATTYNRWNAHEEEKLHISLYTPEDGEAVTRKLALKAAHGKIVPTPIDPPTNYITVSVTKQWVLDDGGQAADSVTVQLFQNGKAYGSPKVLTAAKQWTDTWYVPAGYTYTVEELQVPDGFTASVKGSGTSFTIVNDDIKADTLEDPEQPTTPDKPTKPDKPTNPEQPTKPEDKTEVPKTGDSSALAGSALLLTLSACGIAAALRRKEEK